MAMRLLVSVCCIVTSSAADVYSEHQFKTVYDTLVLSKDAAEVRTINANIVGTDTPPNQVELHKWYHDVSAAVQADAQAIMGKALANKAGSAPTHPTADCLALIHKAMTGATWALAYPVYIKILGETDTGLSQKEIDARTCINALSGAEKELAIQAGLRANLVKLFNAKANIDCPAGGTMLKASEFVTGTLAAAAPAAGKPGEKTQPMYSQAEGALRGELMTNMVNRLNAVLPTPV